MKTYRVFLYIAFITLLSGQADAFTFSEGFDDRNFSGRGWYDSTNLELSTTERVAGSASSARFHFYKGAAQPVSGAAIRKKFPETDAIFVSFSIKYSKSWTGSNRSYHPHQFMIMTNKNNDWDGMAYTRLTVYIEENEGRPLISIQDGQNIDESRVGQNLTAVTERRAVAGCNGDSDGYGNGQCYVVSGSTHWNGKEWRAPGVYFSDSVGPYYKGDWHLVQAYIKLNSIANGKAVNDGIIEYWYDGKKIISHNNVIMRTGYHPDMKFNQFIIAPWIGDGSPVDQTFWVDNLVLSSTKTTDSVPPKSPVKVNLMVLPKISSGTNTSIR